MAVARAYVRRAALASALVVPGAQTRPTGQVLCRGERIDVGTDFRRDDFGNPAVDSGDLIEALQPLVLVPKPPGNLRVDLLDLLLQPGDVRQQLTEDQPVMRLDFALERLRQQWPFGFHPV